MINVSVEGTAAIQQLLSTIGGATAMRRILQRTAKQVIDLSKQHTRDQIDSDGQRFKPHAKGRRRKMLTRLMRYLQLVELNDKQAVIGFKNPVHGQIAYKQQFGDSQQFSKSQFRNGRSPDPRNPSMRAENAANPATRSQARALLAAGYKIKRGKGYRTPTLKWITQNLTIARASAILTALRGGHDSWTTVLPGRKPVGVSPSEFQTVYDQAVAEIQTMINS